MSKGEKTIIQNVELSSLARDSERVRLKQELARSTLLPVVCAAQEHDQIRGALPDKSKVTSTQTKEISAGRGNDRQTASAVNNRAGQLPGGVLLVVWLIVICAFGEMIEVSRAQCLASLTEVFWSKPPNIEYILTQTKFASVLAANRKYGEAFAQYKHLIAVLTNAYGSNDQRTIFAKLSMALMYLDYGDENTAQTAWQECMPFLKEPQATAPKPLTDLLLRLARRYEEGDKEAARTFFLATLRFWPVEAGSDSISNVECDLALVDEDLGNYLESNQYHLKAFSALERDGDTPYNLFRLGHIAKTYNELGKFDKAENYSKRALKMATSGYTRDSEWQGQSLIELARAQSGLKEDQLAIKSFLRARTLLALPPRWSGYRTLDRDLYHGWAPYYLAIADSYRRTGDQRTALQLYQDVMRLLKGRESDPAFAAAERNYQHLRATDHTLKQ